MLTYLKLIRIQNLAMLAFMQLLFHFTFLKKATYTPLTADNNFLAMTSFQLVILVLATVLIAAAGYVINDIMDQETDAIANKRIVGKLISEKKAYNFYFILNITGVLLGFYVSNAVGKPSFSALFIIVTALLYLYATTLKQIAVVGNIVVAALLAFSILILGIFDLVPTTYSDNQELMEHVFKILTDYAIFAFIINLLREIVKDVEDFDADAKTGIATLPVLIGKKKTMRIVFCLSFVPILLLAYYLKENLFQYDFVVYYALLFIIAPLLFFTIKSWNSNTQQEFKYLNRLLLCITILYLMLKEKLQQKRIILASGSPRRQQFFKELDIDFEVQLKEVNEDYPKNLKAEEITNFLAQLKANAFTVSAANEILITSDTIVWHKNKALGKPKNDAEALDMLQSLCGTSHEVITSVCFKTINGDDVFFEKTKVYFKSLTDEALRYYIKKYKPLDKAGAYGIQEWIGLVGIEKIEGSYANVVGMPINKVYDKLLSYATSN